MREPVPYLRHHHRKLGALLASLEPAGAVALSEPPSGRDRPSAHPQDRGQLEQGTHYDIWLDDIQFYRLPTDAGS